MRVTKIRDAKGHPITYKEGVFNSMEGGQQIAGAQARVETAGDLDRRITATRLILIGSLAFGFRTKRDNRELYLTVEGEDRGVVLTLIRSTASRPGSSPSVSTTSPEGSPAQRDGPR